MVGCPLGVKPVCLVCSYGKELLCDYPFRREMAMEEIRETTESMIKWKFECLRCGYKFRAVEPIELYNIYVECSMCGGKDFNKTILDN